MGIADRHDTNIHVHSVGAAYRTMSTIDKIAQAATATKPTIWMA